MLELCRTGASSRANALNVAKWQSGKVARIHSVAWYISMITDEYISLDEELQELEKQREFDASLYSFGS